MRTQKEKLQERIELIHKIEELKNKGITLDKIPKILKVAKSRILNSWHLRSWLKEKYNNLDKDISLHFTVRTANVLYHLNIKTKDQIIDAYEKGLFNPKSGSIRNFGKQSYEEIKKYLGISDDDEDMSPELKKLLAKKNVALNRKRKASLKRLHSESRSNERIESLCLEDKAQKQLTEINKKIQFLKKNEKSNLVKYWLKGKINQNQINKIISWIKK